MIVNKNEMYVGKGYLSDDILKHNVIAVDMNKDSAYSYLLSLNVYETLGTH